MSASALQMRRFASASRTNVPIARPMDDLPFHDYRTDLHENTRWIVSGENVASTTSTGALSFDHTGNLRLAEGATA